MSVESAVAIAGGFSPRAKRDQVTLTHTDSSGSTRYVVPLGTAISPGDTVLVGETLVLRMSETTDQPLRILHAVRAPVGGIFRHILDVANGQANRGHHVGIIADSLTGGERAEAALAEIAPRLKLGVRRIAIHREPPSCGCLGMGPFQISDLAAEAGRAARTWRQGRYFRAPASAGRNR